MVAKTVALTFLALSRGAVGLEDAAALVQLGHVAAEAKPDLMDLISKFVPKTPEGKEGQQATGEEQKPGFLGSMMRTLAAGAEADGDGSMSNFFTKASDLADALKGSTATPPPTETSGDHLAKLGHSIEDWGKKAQSYFNDLEGSEEKQDKKILSGLTSRIAQAMPAEMREKAAQLKSKAMKAKEQIGQFGTMLQGLQANMSSAEAQAKAKQRMEALGGLVQERLKKGVDIESHNAQNIRKLMNFVKELKADSPETQAASKNPLAGINDLAAGLRRTVRGEKAPTASAPVEEQPVQAEAPKKAAVAPVAPPVAAAPQMQAPLLPRVAPTLPPQQWGPPAQPAWQPMPPAMPMGYPMGAQPMPQYMPQYPPQMR